MTTFEWFLLIVVVIGVPLVVAVFVTLWTLEQARQRNRRNRSDGSPGQAVKRNAVRPMEAADAGPPADAQGTAGPGQEPERSIS